jgi:hypothetical protein
MVSQNLGTGSSSPSELFDDSLLDPEIQDAFLRLLEGTDLGERTLFQSISPFDSSPDLDRQFQGLFTPTFNQFLGALGDQIRSGEEPSLTFNQFLTEQFDPRRALLQLPGRRGDVAAGGTFFRFNP